MNAKELADLLRRDANHIESYHGAVKQSYPRAMADCAELLVPKYRPPQPSDSGMYCFLEELPNDAPPALVRLLGSWHYWTVAGWRELTKGVWPCERPE